MLYIITIVCVFQFLYCISVVFMMQQLKSMVVLNYPISYQLDISKKVVEKVVMHGANIKDSCSAPQHNIETTSSPQLDNTQRLSRMIEEIPDICEFTLKHEPEQAYILPKSCVMEFLKANDWLNIIVLQLWCS